MSYFEIKEIGYKDLANEVHSDFLYLKTVNVIVLLIQKLLFSKIGAMGFLQQFRKIESSVEYAQALN